MVHEDGTSPNAVYVAALMAGKSPAEAFAAAYPRPWLVLNP
jgi:hypothetical protein